MILLKFNIKAASIDIIQPLDFNFAVLCANCYNYDQLLAVHDYGILENWDLVLYSMNQSSKGQILE